MNCIICKVALKDCGSEGQNQPIGGIAFQTYGHYGSTAFDPMDGTYLEINVCDSCLKLAAGAGNVLMGFPQPAPPRGPMVKWPMTEIEQGDRQWPTDATA